MLRYGKPQSPFLSYYIRTRTIEREKRVTKMQALQEVLIAAEGEDNWDRILSENAGVAEDSREKQWASCIKTTLVQINQVHTRNKDRRIEFAHKMYEIVKKEKALVEQERAERKHLKYQAYRDRENGGKLSLSTQSMNR